MKQLYSIRVAIKPKICVFLIFMKIFKNQWLKSPNYSNKEDAFMPPWLKFLQFYLHDLQYRPRKTKRINCLRICLRNIHAQNLNYSQYGSSMVIIKWATKRCIWFCTKCLISHYCPIWLPWSIGIDTTSITLPWDRIWRCRIGLIRLLRHRCLT